MLLVKLTLHIRMFLMTSCRTSETFVGDYSLSFWRRGEVHHVPIRVRQLDTGVKRFYMIDKEINIIITMPILLLT